MLLIKYQYSRIYPKHLILLNQETNIKSQVALNFIIIIMVKLSYPEIMAVDWGKFS